MSRFLRFFRVFALIIACAFSAFSAQAYTITLDDGDAKFASNPSTYTASGSNYSISRLTDLPYRPGFAYAGHYKQPNCGDAQRIDYQGNIIGTYSGNQTLYPCWVPILQTDWFDGGDLGWLVPDVDSGQYHMIILQDGTGMSRSEQHWRLLPTSSYKRHVVDSTGRDATMEYLGDWVLLGHHTKGFLDTTETGWYFYNPRSSDLTATYWFETEDFTNNRFTHARFNPPVGFVLDGGYFTSGTNNGSLGILPTYTATDFGTCTSDDTSCDLLLHNVTDGSQLLRQLDTYNYIEPHWSSPIFEIYLDNGPSYSGTPAEPSKVYLNSAGNFYDTFEHAKAGNTTGRIYTLTTRPQNGDLEFLGYFTLENGMGIQVVKPIGSSYTPFINGDGLYNYGMAFFNSNPHINFIALRSYWANPTTWATLEIDDQGATTSSGYNVDNTWYSLEDAKLYSAVTGNYCTGGYRTQPDCGLVSINSVTKPVKNGWVFGGYYTAINGGGEPFGTDGGNNIWNFPSDGITQDMTIYAKWTTEYYPITLLNGSQSYTIYEKYNDGWYRKNGNQYVEITASIFENVNSGGAGLAVPGGDGFRGYYNAQGVQVIQSNGVIIADPIYDAPTTFTAQFNGSAAVQIRLNKGDEASWGNCGQDSITVVPGGEFPTLECTPTMTGHRFDGYIDNETEIQYYSSIYPVISVVPDSDDLPQELHAKWSRVVNKLQYDCDGVGVHAVQIVYNDPYVIWDGLNGLYDDCPSSGASEDEAGRKLFGWEVKESPNAMFARQYQVGEVVNHWPFWNGGQYASSIFKPIYYVTLNHAGDIPEVPLANTPSPNFVYFSNGKWYRDNLATDQITHMDVAPQKVGYNFDGYETASHANAGAFNNVSPTFINSIGVQLYAKWSPKVYRVDLESGGSGGTERLFYRIDMGWYTNSDFGGQPVTRIIKPTSIPSGKVFGGYYTAPNGGGERAIDADGNILYTGTGANSGAMNLIQLLGSDQTLYVKWDDEASVPEGENEKFIVHTTSMSANARFAFSMSAAGDFYVQWDANDDSTIQHIGRDNTNLTTYEHTYSAAAPDGRDIVIWGTPTGYNGGSGHIGSSVITFAEGSGTPLLVAGVSGSLGGVFRTIGDGAANWKNPSFYWTFSGCSNLNSLPENLFGYTNNGNYVGVTGSRPYMFAGTFDNTGLTSIPGNLFGRMVGGTYNGVSGAAEHMFEHVFSGTNITSIPSGLFAGISGAADYMFAATFAGTNLNTDSYPIPGNLFAGVTGNAEGLFAAMFEGCANLKTVPSNLFINVSGSAKGMFGSTFMASGLTSLPRGLFSGVTGTAESIFHQTFSYCSGLAGKYIPKDLFNLSGLRYNANNNMMASVFDGTNLATSCDAFNLTHYPTNYDNTYWEGKVICAPAATFSCENTTLGGGTGTPSPNVIWADQITSSTTLPAATNCTAPTHYTKPSTAYWACTGNSNCTGNPNHWAAGGSKPSWLTSSLTQSVNFYMEYTPKEYSVSLNANGGSFGGNGVQTLYETYNTKWATTSGGTAITSLTSAQLPTRENWNFLGYWDTNAATDGNLMIAPDGTINASTTTLTANGSTWYARWSQSTGPFTVTYLCGDHGTGTPGTQTVNYNESMTLKAASVCTAATGYTFDKWKIIANGVEKNAGATYVWPLHSGSNIVAQWQPVETTITLNNQGGVWNDGVPTESRSLYTTYGAGVYRDAARQEGMGTNDYPLTYVGTAPYSPTKTVTLTLDFADSGATMRVGNQTYTGSMSLPILLPFVGYYTAANGGTQVIRGRFKADGTDEPSKGFITETGMATGAGYTTDQTWHAHWLSYTVSNMETAVPQRAGYVFNGWWTDGGTQITDANGDFIDGNLVINADTTWYAHWTECSHTMPSNSNAGMAKIGAINGACSYHITCNNTPYGYTQHGGVDETQEFDITAAVGSYSGVLEGAVCLPRTYNIEYNNVEEHGGTMPSGDWYTYTYGVSKTINAVPTSQTEVFDSWCDDLSNASTCSATKTIGATEYGDKIYYAKWADECQRGYERLAHDVMMSQVYDDNDSWHWAVPNYTTWYLSAGTCVPKIYHVRCNKNCGGDTCAACLEDFVMDGYNWHLGGGYNVKDFCNDTDGFNTWIFGGFTPVRARVSGDPENGTNVFSNCNNGTGIEPNYIWLNSYYSFGEPSSMLSRLYSTVGDYNTGNYNHLLQSLSGSTNTPSRSHYTFGGLWTTPTGGIQYIDANGNFANGNGTAYNKVPWPSGLYDNYDARAFQNFFFDNNIAESTTPVSGGGRTFDVYAHWIPDVYTITLNKNGGGAGISQIYEKWNTVDGWSSDNSTFVSANNFTLSSSQLPIKSKYDFNGYWTNSSCDGSGVQIIKPNGQLNTNVSNISNATYFGGAATLYACWEPKAIKVNLDHANATTNYFGTTWLTAIADSGVYIDVDETMTLMYPYSTDPQQQTGPAITLPRHIGDTVKFIMNCSGVTGGPADQNPEWDFKGYYSSSASNAKECIDKRGYITSNTTSLNSFCLGSYNVGRTWHAVWIEKNTIKLPNVYNPGAGFFGCPNKIFDGWWTTASGNGTNVGSAGTSYTVPNGGNNLYARWSDCGYTGGANGTVAPGGTSGVGDDNSCIYTLTCNTNYACPNGDASCTIYGEANTPLVAIPDCVAVAYTITYKDVDNTELHTQGYSYSTDPITLWTPDSDILVAHHASSVTWCAGADGTNCETDNQIGPDATGNKIFFAKWGCVAGYSLDSNGVCAYSKYDVTYDCGAAGGQHTYSNSATFNSSYTVKTLAQAECPTTLAGYTFNGWHVEPANDDWNAGDTFTWEYTANQTFAAQWEPNKYRVILNKNASDAVVGTVGEIWEKWNNGWALTQDGTYNSAQTLAGNQLPTRTGYTFAGYWDASASSGGNQKGSVSNGVWTTPPATAADVNPTTWYARWSGNQYTVTYNCGIGTGNGSVDNTPRYGQPYTPKTYAAAGCERPSNGYYFDGWNVAPGHSNSDIKNAGEAFGWDYTENQIFTARWVAKEYHITFNKNGGSDGTDEVWELYGANGGFWHDANQNHITTITLPNWSGHTFAGYAFNGNTVISGSTLPNPTFDFGDTSNNSTVDITLVAQWNTNTYDVRYNLGGGTTTLPVGYVPVEYITFTGTQVIDTGLKIKKGYEIQTKFYPTDTDKYVYGALSSGNSKSVTGYVSTAAGNWRWGNKAISKTMSLNNTYTIVQNASALTVNGVPVAYGTQDNFETGVTLSIGKAHSASGGTNYDTSGFKGRMYWFTIRDDNGNVVYHGVPVKNTANNQYGLCNIIDGTCLTASGINGATATLPATYNHGTATTVSGSAARANSVFNSWCSSPSSNCNSAQTIPATATGDKTFYAKWTCDAGYSYSSGGACVANTITLDWNENGGVGLTNGSCTYNGDLTLGVAPTYADHVFNGWKLANNTYGGASTTVNGGCVQAYTGVTSGTSTAITAQWCNACNPTNATCELNATAQPGTCTYTTSCNTGYHLSPDSQLNVYNTVCIPYTITYQSDGHGDGVTDEVLHNSIFTTNDAKNSSQFSWNNHIVTAWTRVSGGNFPNLDTEYPYNVQSDTVLKANWGECHCTAGTGATSCDTISSNNACEVNVIVCDTGFTGSTWSCDGINCTATCNNDNRHTITLNKNNGTGGTTTLYTISGTGSDAGVYINSARTNRMTPNPNGTYPITAPTLSRTVSYDITSNGTVTGASFAQQPTSANTSAVATFNGYYISKTGTEKYIESDRYINATGVSKGKGYTTDKTWYAQWTYGSVTLPIAYRPGYTLSGWSTTVGGTSVGNAGDSYTTDSNVTLYPVWTQCAAGTYCPGVETVNNQTVYNVVNNCPTNYPNSAVGSTMISDCYLVLTPGKYVSTAGNGMVNCTQNYYCDDDTTKVYYSDPGDGRRTTGIRKSCATNAGSFSLTDGTGKTSINACYKNVTLNKRGGSGTVGGASDTNDGSTSCFYNQNCTLPDASILQLTGYTFHGGWTDQPDTDCNSTTRVFVVPDEVDTYYACRTTNSYTVTLKDGLNTNTVFGTITPTYGAAMPSVDSNGNLLTVPTKNAGHTTYIFEGYYDAQQNGVTATQYYDYNLNSVHDWNTESNGTLYARWSVTCDPGYYLPANATSCTTLCPAGRYCAGNTTFTSFDVPKSSNQGLSGYIAAGYYSTGGASTSTPSGHVTTGNGCYGQVSGADTACGIVAGGYYSTGGGTSATPTAAGNGCLSGSGRSCGKVAKNYFSNGGGKTSTPTATGCVTGRFCGICPATYRSNSNTGKASITECVAACAAGTRVATAEDPTVNNAEATGCTTPTSNNWWSNAHNVNYGSASPTVTGVNENGVHMCVTNYNTSNTSVADDHNEQHDCRRSITLYKNGGTIVDGAVWPDNVTDGGGAAVSAVCYEDNANCAFGNPADLLENPGYTFQNQWGTNSSCANPVVSPVANADISSSIYYACRNHDTYTLTYACGTGTTGTAPASWTGHYHDPITVSDAGNCAKTGHTFAGWAVTPADETRQPGAIDGGWPYMENQTFTAQWTPDTYNISYVGNGGTAGSLLPDGYTQLEYIDTVSTTGPYINTGITYDSTKEIIVNLVAQSNGSLSSGNMVALGFGGSSGQWFGVSSGEKWTIGTGGVSNVVAGNKTADIQIRWSGGTEYLNVGGISVGNRTVTNTSATLQFFGRNNSGSFTGKMYSAQVIVDGVLVHNYVPAQNSNGVVGLYDTVTGVFFTNLGNGSFTPGNPVTAAYPNQYTYGVGATVTGGAVRANSVFEGWCRTASLTNCAAPHEITTTDLGDITLYAKWGCVAGYHDVNNQCVANEFTLVYNKNGHGTQNTPDNQTCTYGQQINLAAALSETGWNFNGWTIAGENYVGGAPIICNEQYLGVTGGTVNVNVNVTADWSATCNRISLNKNNSGASYGSIRYLYAKTRENGSTTNGKWYKDDTCTTEYTSADYESIKPTRSGWTFRGFYANSSNAADISATQTNGVEQHINHTGAPTSTGQTFINGLNAPATLYAGWARDCTDPVAHGTCSQTIGQNTTYTTTCVTGYHYDPAASESTYNPICVPNTISIILDKNGGTGTCGGQSGTASGTLRCAYDGVCNTPVWNSSNNSSACELTKNGKVFAGWNTVAGGTGTQYGTATVAGDVQNINNGTTSTTLYAVWENAVCNVANGSATVSVSGNTVACDVTCNNGYESNGIYTGQQHATSVTTGQCNAGTYDIRYHYDAEHGGALASLLPDGDERVQYVQNAASTYVRTGITPDADNVEVSLRFYQNGSGNSLYLLQSRASSSGTLFGISGSLSGSTINAVWNGGGVRSDISRVNGHVYTVNAKFVNGVSTLYVRDETSGTEATNIGTYTFAVPSSPFGLFGNYGGNTIDAGQRVYSASIKVNGVMVMDYIPAVRNSVAGFYDVISGEFKGAYTGTLSAGAPVTVAHPNQYTYGTGATVYGGATRANSVFEGWCRNAALTDGCTMVPHVIGTTEYDDKDLYAKWSCVNGYHLDGNNQCVGNTITINYQNGGHGGTPPSPRMCTYGGSTDLASAMGAVGYVFSGWELNGEVYDEEEPISCNYNTLGVYSGNVTAVAVWDTQAYTVTYDCNTSWTPNNAPASQNTQTDAQFTVKSNTCVNPGYRFVKWAVSGTNPQEYKNEAEQFTWRYSENKTFSAVWEIDDTDAFTVTVDMPANTEFKFNTIATGQFWVDWDDNSSIEEYAPTTITTKTWTHTYATAGTYDIKIGGRATGYAVSANGTPETKPAISFFNGTLSDSTSIDATVTASGTEQYITAVSGKLGAIFPTITAGSWGGQPRFYRTFKNTTAMTVSLQSIADLFDGISGVPVHYMFAETFDGSAVTGAIPAGLFPVSGAPKTALFLSTFRNCTGLTGTIPANLFVNISGAPAASMFSRTFRGCTGLTGIPAGLFRNISGAPAEAMFYATFYGCTNITGTLSSNLFGSLNGPIAKDMFRSTFYNCTSLVGDASDSTVAIPNGMFGTLTASTTAATRAFSATFYGCAALRGKIGGALFGGLTGNPAEYMFSNTFNTCGDRDITTNCSNLNGNIPTNLFGNMTGAPKPHMFYATFKGASKLTGAIPSKLFGTITGAPATSMFQETFRGCSGLTGIIPANLFENISGLPAGGMFYSTFYGCSHLSGIGGALFSGISGRAATSMFFATFCNCSGLQGSIPEGLFGTPTTPASWMFGSTFYGCSGLTGEIPSNLFSSVTGSANYMFDQTFRGCSGLTGTIPSGLFGRLSGAGKEGMFRRTFYNCSHLTGYVPEGLFGTMTKPSTVPTDMMTKVFAGTGLDTVCPCGTTKVDNVFEEFWDSTTDASTPDKVSCRVGLKPGEHWYGNQCTTECSDTAIDELHVGNLDPYIVLTDPVSTVKNLAVKHNDTICYVPVASGNGGASSLNMKYGNTVYHADRPNDTPPAGFGQR